MYLGRIVETGTREQIFGDPPGLRDGDGDLVACHLVRRERGVPRRGDRVHPSTDRAGGR